MFDKFVSMFVIAGLTTACHQSQPAGGDIPPGSTPPEISPGAVVRVWPPSDRTSYINPIPSENALVGDPGWSVGPNAAEHELEGYGDRASAKSGDRVSFRVSANVTTTFTWTVYRFGWYGGAGARALVTGGPLDVAPQAACPLEGGTGLVRCNWTPSFSLDVSDAMVSGLYAVKLTRKDGKVSFIPLIITDLRPADLLFQASFQTYAAYNPWGGQSLYQDGAFATKYGYSVKISLDKPFFGDRGLGQMLEWEVVMARFLERHGYDVTYATNIDVAFGGVSFLSRAGMFMTVGHDEYWAGSEREAVEGARDEGVPLAFFSANTGYWKVRYEDFTDATNPRTIVCYKGGDDPQGAALSGLFRGAAIKEPENELVGVMYDSFQLLASPMVVADASSWLFDGTGLNAGDSIRGIVGYEFDREYPQDEPPNIDVLTRSPVMDNLGRPSFAEVTSYRAKSGALVFAAGSIYWSRGLDPKAVPDLRLERMTTNVFQEGLGLPVPSALQTISSVEEPPPTMGPVHGTVTTVTAGLRAPAGIAVMPGTSGAYAGQLVVTSTGAPQILLVNPATGAQQILAGDGVQSVSAQFDNVPGRSARFDVPIAVAVDSTGRVYVADSGSYVIRRIETDALHTTTTIAGAPGVPGNADGVGKAARFSSLGGIAIDPTGSILYIADAANHLVRSLDLRSMIVSTVAGSVEGDVDGPGLKSRFDRPTGVAVSPDGRVFVVSSASRKIKVIDNDPLRTVVTIAGGKEGDVDGAGNVASLSPQAGVAWLGGFLAVSDIASRRIRSLVPSTSSALWDVETLAFSGSFGRADGNAQAATIALPVGIAAGQDVLYVVDGDAGSIRAVRVTP